MNRQPQQPSETSVAPGRGGPTWLKSLVAIPAALLPLLPGLTCPACLPAYLGLLSSLGLGFVLNERVQRPLIVLLLALTVVTVAGTSRHHKNVGPLLTVLSGSLAVIAGRLVWNVPLVVYVGVAVLLAGTIWNLALKRRRRNVASGPSSERSTA